MPIRVPPYDEQVEIGQLLGALDDKIELHRHMNETLEAMARAIFKDWFVDFGPTRAKIEGRAPYLAPEIWALFADGLDDEGKPEGWTIGTLGDIAVSVGDRARAQVNFLLRRRTSARTYAASVNRAGKSGLSRKSRPIAGTGLNCALATFCSRTSTLLALRYGMRRLRADPALTELLLFAEAPAREIICLVSCVIPDEHAYLSARDPIHRTAVRQDASDKLGTMEQPNFSPSHTCATTFACFRSYSIATIRADHCKHSSNRNSATTRDFLLPKLMSGEIRAKDAENVAEAAS